MDQAPPPSATHHIHIQTTQIIYIIGDQLRKWHLNEVIGIGRENELVAIEVLDQDAVGVGYGEIWKKARKLARINASDIFGELTTRKQQKLQIQVRK